MNRSALKNYAPKARLAFIRAVTERAAFFGLTSNRTEPMQETGDVVIIGGRAFPRVVGEQRKKLQERINQHGFDQVMEAMAYTWFNRFVALRYMELHGYLDHGYRVLSAPDTENGKHGDTEMPQLSASDRLRVSASSSSASPEILMHAEHVTLPGLDAQQVINLKLDGSREAELYRVLLVAQCNALNKAMPFLFEKIADDTELLLPDNLLHSDSVIRKLVNEIKEADWQQVEIIGWLYQFYISDKKDEVIGKVVKSEDIPAATQLFTPNWIVKYLVQNTLGRQWLATYPDSPLRQQMEYYIEPAEQADEVKAQLVAITPKSLDPEKLTLLDDACGSGHILVEAYDLFKAIYQERGYRSKDIPRLILQKNLFGLEIDDRAAQLAAFALLMKARADDRRVFADLIQTNVVAIQESKGLETLLTPDPGAAPGAGELPFSDSDLFPDTQKQLTLNRPTKGSPLAAVESCLRELINLFEHGKTFGSLIRVPTNLAAQLPTARQHIETMIDTGQLWEHRVATLLLPLVKQAELLAKTHDAVVTNPPYMGSRYFTPMLKAYLKAHFPAGDADLCTAFLIRGIDSLHSAGRLGMITLPNWMFLPTFESLRQEITEKSTLEKLTHNGRGVFGADFGSCAFVISTLRIQHYRATCHRLFDVESFVLSNDELPERFLSRKPFLIDVNQLCEIPGRPIAYWIDRNLLDAFRTGRPFAQSAPPRQGLATADNDRFLRLWAEVDVTHIGWAIPDRSTALQSRKRWFPYSKGGSFRRWYGNNYLVVNWADDGEAIRNFRDEQGKPRSRAQNTDYYFREAITWSLTSVSQLGFAARYRPAGYVFDINGMSAFPSSDLYLYLALLNSDVACDALKVINPTFAFQAGDIARIPLLPPENKADLEASAKECVSLAKEDWDASEVSWDFTGCSMMGADVKRQTVCETWNAWRAQCQTKWERLVGLENAINSAFDKAYSLESSGEQDDSAAKPVLMFKADREMDLVSLVSYAIGCMMGRYSLDKPGLVYAHSRNEGFDASQYQTFPADADGIIPITELAWFQDDATERFVEFITKAWPREHLEENLKFIADSLGANRDEHPRDTIRRYLSQNFYKDHLQTYKRRPIYWLFSSGKQKAFSCLVYLHRYHEGTLARMRTEYVIPLQGKLSHRIEQLAGDIAAATSTSHRRKLEKERETLVKQHTELVAFDEKLRHYADQRIALDLDDGVKVNYGKFGDLLAEVKAVTGGTEE